MINRRVWSRSRIAVIAAIVGIPASLVTLYSFFFAPSTELGQLLSPERERVLVAQTVSELRSKNDVRPLRYEEQSADLSRLSGIYGFTAASFFESNMRLHGELLYTITLQNEPERYKGVIEVHKTTKGRVMIVGYVDEGTAARVVDTSRAVGSVFLHHKPRNESQIPIAIPASRIREWDYRAPHEFSEIEID